MERRIGLGQAWLAVMTIAALACAAHADEGGERFRVFESVALEWKPDSPEVVELGEYRIRKDGRIAERTIALPPLPDDQRDARRITATLEVEPRLMETEDGFRPGDPWTRLGNVSIALPNPDYDPDDEDDDPYLEVELMRFITGFGGPGTFTANLTPYAPLLADETTLRVFISTYMQPGWDVSLTLQYTEEGVGYRRPVFAERIFHAESVNAEENVLNATVAIPAGLDRPRLYILSTGHATDGRSGDEFITRTHVLRIDGEEIARWRPWAEDGGALRPLSPMSSRFTIDGRELRSSDLDRSGWHPGLIVEPVIIPVPELMPGEREIELEIIGIRPMDPDDPHDHHGYWRTSVNVVADEPWPRVRPRRIDRE